MNLESKAEAGRAVISGGVITLWGLSLNEFVAIFTLVYLASQIIVLLPKVLQVVRDWTK